MNVRVVPQPRGNILARFWKGWQWFWFTPASPVPLGLIRVLAGLGVLYIHLAYTVDLDEFFGADAWLSNTEINRVRNELPWMARPPDWDEVSQTRPWPAQSPEELEYMRHWGQINPRQVSAKGYPVWSIWFHVTDPTWMRVAHFSILGVMLLFTLGVGTRVTGVLTWLAAVSYFQRSPTTLFGQDTMMNILLFYLMIGPSGAALSVDRLVARWWNKRQAVRAGKPAPTPSRPAPVVSANLALRLMQVNLCFIYMMSGMSKLQGQSWWNFTAIWGTMANPEFAPMQHPLYLTFLRWLCQHRPVWEIFMFFNVFFTLFFELSFCYLVWLRRWRWVMLAMGYVLHLGIGAIMQLNTFSLFMMILLTSFIPVEALQALLDRLGRAISQLRRAVQTPAVEGERRLAPLRQ